VSLLPARCGGVGQEEERLDSVVVHDLLGDAEGAGGESVEEVNAVGICPEQLSEQVPLDSDENDLSCRRRKMPVTSGGMDWVELMASYFGEDDSLDELADYFSHE
jgi:hypothetical protein